MPWLISFIVSWILFLISVDYKRIKSNIIAGLLALAMASIVDWGGQHLGLYTFRDLIIPWFGCSAFYKFGPVLTMGALYAQSVPEKKWMQAANIGVFSFAFLALEMAIIRTGVAEHLHWHPLGSLFVNILAFGTLTWFTKTFLRSHRGLAIK